MAKFNIIFGIFVALLFVALGLFLLLDSRFSSIPQTLRVIFAVFLFLYGALRMVRYIFKKREDEDRDV